MERTPILSPPCPQVCRKDPSQKGKYIKIILALLQSISTAVVYECAVTLVSLSQAPTAIRWGTWLPALEQTWQKQPAQLVEVVGNLACCEVNRVTTQISQSSLLVVC